MLEKIKSGINYVRRSKVRMALFLIGLGLLVIRFFETIGVATWLLIFWSISSIEIYHNMKKAVKKGTAKAPESTLRIFLTMFHAITVPTFASMVNVCYRTGNPWWGAVIGLNAYMTDAAASLIGPWLKKLEVPLTPLWKEANGNKSWQSSILAIIVASLFCWKAVPFILFYVFRIDSPHNIPLYVYVMGSIGAITGDLTESRFKRELGIKDSGDTFGSHGGFLDRCDSLIGTALFYTPYLFFLRG